MMILSSIAFPRFCGTATTSSILLSFLLSVISDLDHAFVVTVHAIDSLTSFGKNKFVDSVLANFAFEAVRVIGIVASHYCLIQNKGMTNIAAERAV